MSGECHFLQFRYKGLKIHKGFFFVQLCLLPITISKIQALLAGELYKEKKECFTQRKRRFEGLQRFSLSGEERMFHTKKTTIRRFTKVFSMRGRKNVSHEENEDSKVYKGFSRRAVSRGLGYYFKNTSPSCRGAL